MKALHIGSLRKMLQTGLLLVTMVLGLSAMPIAVSACGGGSSSSKDQVLTGVGQTGSACTSDGVNGTVKTVVSILSDIVGIAAVIMILVSGFKYIVSNGDSSKVGSAKTTLIYALVGLAVVALTQILIHFVLNTTTSSATPCPYANAVAAHPDIGASDPLCRP